MKLIDMTCPKCGATMTPNVEKGLVECEYCGHRALIEQEDSAEEIQAREQSRAYGYHRGRLQAEAEARDKAAKKEKLRTVKRAAIIIGAILLLVVLMNAGQMFSKPRVNPFECIEVSFQGKDGDGEIMVELRSPAENIDPHQIDLEISRRNNLYQGDTVTIEASSDVYFLTESTKVYTVEGLDEYLKDLNNIPKEALALIHARAESVLELNLDGCKAVGVFVDMKPVKLFLNTDGKQTNELYDVFEVNFTTNAGDVTYYVMACFDDVIIHDGEQVSVDMTYGVYFGNLTQVEGPLFIMGYNSLEEVRVGLLTSQEGYMELKELDL